MTYTVVDQIDTPATRPANSHVLTFTCDANLGDIQAALYQAYSTQANVSPGQPPEQTAITDIHIQPDGLISITASWTW